MKFITNKILIASSEFDPGADLETPDDKAFASTPLREPGIKIDNGVTKPWGHTFQNGDRGISKTDAVSHTFEPLAYQLGKRLHVSVPRTVLRMLPHGITSLPALHSVQEKVHGKPFKELHNDMKRKAIDHSDYRKMAMFDWLTGNDDRHDGNFMYDHNRNQVHAIDNGFAGNYRTIMPEYSTTKDGHVINAHMSGHTGHNLYDTGEHPIPEDFRKAITNTNPEEHAAIWARYLNHPTFDKMVAQRRIPPISQPQWYHGVNNESVRQDLSKQYLARLSTLKHHFANPQINTMRDLYYSLYPAAVRRT